MSRFLGIMLCLTIWLYILDLAGTEAESHNHGDTVSDIQNAIQTLQPWFVSEHEHRQVKLLDVSDAIHYAAERYDFDAMFAVSVANRESSLLPMIGLGEEQTRYPERGDRWVGAAGERGYFQIMPGGAVEMICGHSDCDQFAPTCNAMTALCAFDYLRRDCETNDLWVILYAYGYGICVSPDVARSDPSSARVRQFYCSISSDCDARWPI